MNIQTSEQQIKERKALFEKEILKVEQDVDQYTDFELLEDCRYGDTAYKPSIKKNSA